MEEDDADNRRRNPTREVRKYRWSNSGYRQCDIVASREMEKNRIIGNEYTPQLCRKQLRGNSSSQLVLGRNVPAAIKVLLTRFSNLLQLIPAKASDFRCMRFSYSPFVSPADSGNEREPRPEHFARLFRYEAEQEGGPLRYILSSSGRSVRIHEETAKELGLWDAHLTNDPASRLLPTFQTVLFETGCSAFSAASLFAT